MTSASCPLISICCGTCIYKHMCTHTQRYMCLYVYANLEHCTSDAFGSRGQRILRQCSVLSLSLRTCLIRCSKTHLTRRKRIQAWQHVTPVPRKQNWEEQKASLDHMETPVCCRTPSSNDNSHYHLHDSIRDTQHQGYWQFFREGGRGTGHEILIWESGPLPGVCSSAPAVLWSLMG